jgi:hypothetical protein
MTETHFVNDNQSRYIESEIAFQAECDGVLLAVMYPVDTPVVLVKIGEGEEEDRLIENWLEHERVVRLLGNELDKVDLHLFHSAVVMTVQGDWARLSQEGPQSDH